MISLAVFSLIPILILGIISVYFSREVNLHEFRENSSEILKELSEQTSIFMNLNKAVLTSVTVSMLGIKDLSAERDCIQAMLRRYTVDFESILEIYLFDADKNQIVNTETEFNPNPELLKELINYLNSENYSPSVYFTEEHIPFYYDFEIGFLASGEKYILASKTSFMDIWAYIHSKKIGKNGIVFLVNSKNKIVAHPKINMVFKEKFFLIPESDKNYFRYRNVSNEKCFGTAKELVPGEITVILEKPVEEVFGSSRRIAVFTVIIVALMLILISAVSSRFGLRIVRNINNLMNGMKTISSGNLKFRIKPQGEEEFQNIAEGINIMTDRVLDMQEELSEKRQLAEIGTLTSKIAHDLRNPLTPIKTFSELLPEKFDDDEFRAKFSRIVIPRIQFIDDFISEMLEYGKPYKPEIKQFNLSELLMELVSFWREHAEKNNIGITLNCGKDEINISADRDKIFEALMNLMKNAIESFTEETKKREIIISITKIANSKKFILTFDDTGDLISDSKKENMFKPFYTTKKTGTGLGLPIVRKIFDANGWKIKLGNLHKFIITN